MGLFSFLFGPLAPTEPSPILPMRQNFNRTNIPPSDYVVLDLETSGLDPRCSEILEIGAIRVRNHEISEQYHTYIKPVGMIPSSATQINHIKWSTVNSAPALEEEADTLYQFIGDDIIVGYNIGFDIKFLQTRTQKDILNPTFDILPLAQEILLGVPNHKLDTLRNIFNLSGSAHSSLGDCETTVQVYNLCRKSPEYEYYLNHQKALDRLQQELEERRLAQIAKQEAVKKRNDELKKSLPSTKELYKISAQMEGSSFDYISAAVDYLVDKVEDAKLLHISLDNLSYDNVQFMTVKTSGRLRYITLDVPPDEITCKDFICAPTSNSEFFDGTRIYLSRPDDILKISDALVAAYKHSLSRVDF